MLRLPLNFKLGRVRAKKGAPGAVSNDKLRVGLPVGFDPTVYLSINKDVSERSVDAVTHYLNFGRRELRTILREGMKLNHPESRMFSTAERDDWQQVVRGLSSKSSIGEVLRQHPRYAWLHTGFCLGSYLQSYQDVARNIPEPLFGALHFLEFGLEEGRSGTPNRIDYRYVDKRYGLDPKFALGPANQAYAELLSREICPTEVALEEGHEWELAGFAGDWLANAFDHEYYHAMASRSGSPPPSFERSACIRHFVGWGLSQLIPINPELALDTEFYRKELTGRAIVIDTLNGLDSQHNTADTQLYAHFLKFAPALGIAPNLSRWIATAYPFLKMPFEIVEQLPIFRAAAGMSPDAKDQDIIRAISENPWNILSSIQFHSSSAVDFAVSLADNLSVLGSEHQAEKLYWMVLDATPFNARTRVHLADIYQRRGNYALSQWLRERPDASIATGWNALNLTEIYLLTSNFEKAASTLVSLRRDRLGNAAISMKLESLARSLFNKVWENLAHHVAAYGVARTQAQLRSILKALTPVDINVSRKTSVAKIALVGNDDIFQCAFYRIDQKAEQLREAGFNVKVFSASRSLEQFTRDIDSFDAVIFFRVAAFPVIIDAIVAARQRGILTFYEIDDLVFDSEVFPPPLSSYSGQIDESHHASMACGVPLFEHAMSLCEYGIASTSTVARFMQDRVEARRVFVHPNALGRPHFTQIRNAAHALRENTDASVTIFYGSGTKAHKEEFHEVLEPALARLIARFPKSLKVRLIGDFGPFRYLDRSHEAISVRAPTWDYEEYFTYLAEADINISILEKSPLTDAKSEIKWLEAAMLGIPSVVSDTATFREVISDGVDGFLCRTENDFVISLERLIRDQSLRVSIGEAARKKALNDYSVEAMGQNLRAVFDELRPQQPAKKRILIVNVFYPPQAIGGATRVVHDNARILLEEFGDRYDIDVVCTLDGGDTPYQVKCYSENGIRVWAITAPSTPEGDMTSLDKLMEDTFGCILDKVQPDIVHFHCIQRLTASVVNATQMRGIPYVITLHDGWWISPNQFIINSDDTPEFVDYRSYGNASVEERIHALARPLLGAERLLAVSKSFEALHRAVGLSNVTTIENGVRPFEVRQKSVSALGRVRLAHIGGISRHKGFHLVRNALLANDYENLELLVVDHAKPWGFESHEVWGTTNVTIQGKTPQSQVADLYANMDVLLAPSIWPESYGLVTREAISAKVWVVASDRGAIGDDIVENINGHRIDVSNYKALMDRLIHINENPEIYLKPPQGETVFRPARQQVVELVELYEQISRS